MNKTSRCIIALTMAFVLLAAAACGKEPVDEHAGQVLVNDGFNDVWITPVEEVKVNPLVEEDFVVEEEGKLLPVVDIVEVEDMDSATMHETEASVLADLSEAEAVEVIGPMATQDMKRSGILASVTTAQFILESGYGHSELAQGANNLFGMKASLSNNTWTSAWDGVSTYTKQTGEQNPDGSYVTITADFRAYPCIEKSIEDHSDYLLGAMKGDQLRYAGLKGEKDYRKAVQLIKDGGYATSLTYVEKLCNIIERWDLTRFDV